MDHPNFSVYDPDHNLRNQLDEIQEQLKAMGFTGGRSEVFSFCVFAGGQMCNRIKTTPESVVDDFFRAHDEHEAVAPSAKSAKKIV